MTDKATNVIVLNGADKQVLEASPNAAWPIRFRPAAASSLDLCAETLGLRGSSKQSSSTLAVPELSVVDAISIAFEVELEMQRDVARADEAKRRRLCSSDRGDMWAGGLHALSPEIPPGLIDKPTAVFHTSSHSCVSTGQMLESRTNSFDLRFESTFFADSPEELPSSQPLASTILTEASLVPLAPKTPEASPKATLTATKGGRGLRPLGFKDVPGFEAQVLRVARCLKKLPKTQSWCFVPLIFSALGSVPEHLGREGISTAEQIVAAQRVWCELFSHWQQWRDELQEVIRSYDAARFKERFLPKGSANGKAWTTSLVYGEPRLYGRLPHPHGGAQDAVLALLPIDVQNQIFASVVAIAS